MYGGGVVVGRARRAQELKRGPRTTTLGEGNWPTGRAFASPRPHRGASYGITNAIPSDPCAGAICLDLVIE